MKTVLAILLLISTQATAPNAKADDFLPSAAPVQQAHPAGARKPEVLDFEGDVIEGQKKAPELFLQLDVEKADLSSVLYDRKDFNDFHIVDSKRRPKFSDPKSGPK
ncbi:MAG: hypothetical protein JST80_08270 [Bdellovibrionales bacterium]|nr:hypothetical protein [Bdellovibrionales bacterium]